MKFQPQHVDFLDVSNPRAVLEKSLRSFSCVTKVGVAYIVAFDFWFGFVQVYKSHRLRNFVWAGYKATQLVDTTK